MQVEQMPIDRLIPYVSNPRKNDHVVDRIAAAIREFGFRVPILAKSDGLVVDGHLRLKAARKLGLKTVPVMLCDDMTEPQIKAFRLSVNKIADLAEWDGELLRLELEDIDASGFEMDLMGFDADELAGLMSDDPPQEQEPDSSTQEIDPDDYQLGHKCPRCGFEFDSDND